MKRAGRFQFVILNYKSEAGAKIRRWCKNSPTISERLNLADFLSYSCLSDISLVGKITPQLFQKQVWLDRFTRPKRRAEDGFWRVISSAPPKNPGSFVLKPKNKPGVQEKIGGRRRSEK